MDASGIVIHDEYLLPVAKEIRQGFVFVSNCLEPKFFGDFFHLVGGCGSPKTKVKTQATKR